MDAGAAALYLDLLKRSQLGLLDEDPAIRFTWDESGSSTFVPFDRETRCAGRDWPSHAPTMVGLHRLDNIQSGRGVVHNALLLDRTERTVVHGPFRPSPRSILHGEWSISPKPPWFVDNKTAATTGRRLSRFAARPRWRALPAIFASALRG